MIILDDKINLKRKDIVITFDGNSHCAGLRCNNDQDFSKKVIEKLASSNINSITRHSFGVSGQTLTEMSSDALTQIDNTVDPSKYNICIYNEAFNSMLSNTAYDTTLAEDHIFNLNLYADLRKQAGFDFVILVLFHKHRLNNGNHPSLVNEDNLNEYEKYFNILTKNINKSKKYDATVDMRLEPHTKALNFINQDALIDPDNIHMSCSGIEHQANYLIKTGFKKYFNLN